MIEMMRFRTCAIWIRSGTTNPSRPLRSLTAPPTIPSGWVDAVVVPGVARNVLRMEREVLVQTMKTTVHTPRWAVLAAQSLGMEKMRETAPKEAVGCTISQDGKTEILVYTVMSIYTKEEFVCTEKLSSHARSQRRPSYCWSSPERPHRRPCPQRNNWARIYSSTRICLTRPG